ncbi:GntP family permease [Frigidibacter sp. MR17.24]|uniref:GntP family permease n=1 Tax=Frigidibacter sp. MR17.24 TaxID=3127345 RepID=UPI003012CEFC
MFGIVLSLLLLMYLAYRGISVLILAPLLALLAAALSGAPILGSYTQVFMEGLANYVRQFFPLFLLGAVFGKLMEVSGSARSLATGITARLGAQRSAMAVVLACGILTYGGVSLFVVAFAVYPIAAALFVAADHPKRLIPAALALGSFTFTMTAVPGTPAIQNAIPSPYFGTDGFAAPVLSLLAALIMFGGGILWLNRRIAAAHARGEGYGIEDQYSRAGPLATEGHGDGRGAHDLPGFWIAIAPVVLVIAMNFAMSRWVLPALDTGYLADEAYGATTLGAVRGIWAIIVALFAAIVLLIALNWGRLRGDLKGSLTDGVAGSFLPIFNTASEVGYGSVIASLPAFAVIAGAVTGFWPSNPLVSEAVAVNALAGITGSASGGLSIALETLGARYAELAQAAGISPQLMHRVAALSSGGFDCLPHNGAVITLLAVTGLNHRQSYGDIFVVAVAVPVLALVTVIVLGSTVGTF